MTLTTAQHPGIGAPLPRAPQRITATTGAREELLQAVALHERVGSPTPCRADPEPFTSDDARERSRAAAMCGSCPLRPLCRSYAVAAGEAWGVWGGVDRSTGQKIDPGITPDSDAGGEGLARCACDHQ